jgi:exonuclease III
MKIVSWNVNGLRAIAKKLPSSLGAFFRDLGADIVCLQETKISEKMLTDDLTQIPGYEAFFATCKMKQGYSGVWYPFDLFTFIYIKSKINRNGIQLFYYFLI